jgi:lipoprotein-releasing system permease protein
MNVPLSLQIAFRYLVSKKSTNAINIITAISMLGMGVGAMALVIVLSVFNGFESLVISLYNKFTPDILVTPATGKVFVVSDEQLKQLKQLEGIATISQTLQEKALLKYHQSEYIATVKGVDDNYLAATGMKDAVVDGSFLLHKNDDDFMVLGAGVKARLGVSLDDKLNAISVSFPKRGKHAGMLLPSDAFVRKFIFPSGVVSVQQGFDEEYVYVPLHFIQNALKYNQEISALEIKTIPGADIGNLKKSIAALMGNNYKVSDKLEQDETLFRVMQTERFAVFAILCFILLIASFNIIGSLTMLVLEKSRDISVLKTMGASRQWIMKVFLLEGVLCALTGSGIGVVLGIVVCWIQIRFGVVPLAGSGSFVVSAYPVQLQISDIFLVLITVLVIGLMAAAVPAWNASKQLVRLNNK